MKETIELVKCDLCGATIDTDNIPEDEYHYRYCISKYIDNTIETDLIEKDICPNCASKINKIYNGKHGEDIDEYIDNVVSELCTHFDFDGKMPQIQGTPNNIRALIKSVFLANMDKE